MAQADCEDSGTGHMASPGTLNPRTQDDDELIWETYPSSCPSCRYVLEVVLWRRIVKVEKVVSPVRDYRLSFGEGGFPGVERSGPGAREERL